eukprot:6186316-Pleurochrysis_carterae.AAC.1
MMCAGVRSSVYTHRSLAPEEQVSESQYLWRRRDSRATHARSSGFVGRVCEHFSNRTPSPADRRVHVIGCESTRSSPSEQGSAARPTRLPRIGVASERAPRLKPQPQPKLTGWPFPSAASTAPSRAAAPNTRVLTLLRRAGEGVAAPRALGRVCAARRVGGRQVRALVRRADPPAHTLRRGEWGDAVSARGRRFGGLRSGSKGSSDREAWRLDQRASERESEKVGKRGPPVRLRRKAFACAERRERAHTFCLSHMGTRMRACKSAEH